MIDCPQCDMPLVRLSFTEARTKVMPMVEVIEQSQEWQCWQCEAVYALRIDGKIQHCPRCHAAPVPF